MVNSTNLNYLAVITFSALTLSSQVAAAPAVCLSPTLGSITIATNDMAAAIRDKLIGDTLVVLPAVDKKFGNGAALAILEKNYRQFVIDAGCSEFAPLKTPSSRARARSVEIDPDDLAKLCVKHLSNAKAFGREQLAQVNKDWFLTYTRNGSGQLVCNLQTFK
mgnify:FL=1